MMTREELQEIMDGARRREVLEKKYPSGIAADLRDYAAKLGLPSDWHQFIGHTQIGNPTGTVHRFSYRGKPFAEYATDVLNEIETVTHAIPLPVPPDPLVVASECAVSQPKDAQWRRFRHLVFRRDEVVGVNNADDKGHENAGSFSILFRNGQKIICGNEKNYGNTGMSTCEFFVTHVMGLVPEGKA